MNSNKQNTTKKDNLSYKQSGVVKNKICNHFKGIGPPYNITSIRQPRKLALRYDHRDYPIKCLICVAHEIALGRELL